MGPKDRCRSTLTRALDLGGLLGPAVFIVDWSVLGAIRTPYSPLHDAISQLAASGATHRWVMTGGFVVYGAGLIGYGLSIRSELTRAGRMLAIGTGLATFGVAAFPLGTPLSGRLHAVFAGIGYVTLAAIPLVSARRLRSRAGRTWARLSTLTGAVSGACLVGSLLGPYHGLLQRAGLTAVDAWVMLTAAVALSHPRDGAATAAGGAVLGGDSPVSVAQPE